MLKKAEGGIVSLAGGGLSQRKREASELELEDADRTVTANTTYNLGIDTKEKMNNFNSFFRNLAKVESSTKNSPSSDKHNAAGFYQFQNKTKKGKFIGSPLHGALNRLTTTYDRVYQELPERFKKIYNSKDVTELSDEDQKELAMANFYERKGTDPLLKAISEGDSKAAIKLYRDVHLTRKGDAQYKKAKKRIDRIFREGMIPTDGSLSEGTMKYPRTAKDTSYKGGIEGLEGGKLLEKIREYIPFSEGGTLEQYYQGQVIGKGDGMSDEILFDVEGRNPDMALLSRDEYVIPADVVSMIGNGSSNAGAEELDGFLKNVRHQSFGTRKQQREMTNPQKGLSALV
jgi:hypothetical protein